MTDVIVLIILLVLSGFFSGSETALTAVPLARVEGLLQEGRAGASALLQLKNNPSRMLITLLIGNNIVNVSASAFATVVATEYLGAIGPGVAVGVLTLLILVFGEITPKSLAIRYSVSVSLIVAPAMLFLLRMLFPLVWAFEYLTDMVHRLTNAKADPSVTEGELVNLLKRGEREGIIEKDEAEMVERVFAFNDLQVSDVMTSRHKMFALKESLTVKQALPEIVRYGFSRIPVYHKDLNDIRTVIHWHDIAGILGKGKRDTKLKDLGYEPLFVPPNQPIDKLFAILKNKKRHLALVVDENGTLLGLVTMENLLEELVGEIYDEKDKGKTGIVEIEDGLELEGGIELRLVKQYFGIDIRGKDSDSVSRWILNDIERIPRPEEHFLIDGFDIVIKEASGRRIFKVNITR